MARTPAPAGPGHGGHVVAGHEDAGGDLDAAVAEAVAAIDATLVAAADPDRAVHERAYLKSELTHHGASVPAVRAAARSALRAGPGRSRAVALALAAALWSAPVHESRLAAVEVLAACSATLQPADLPIVEQLVREARTWALVDPLAISVAGAVVARHPEAARVLDRWVTDDDPWVRRAALLALLVPLREGGGDLDRFLRYADDLLEEPEQIIRKAIGWVLRDLGRRRPEVVYDWLLPRAARASGVTVREALKPLSEDQRAAVQAARSRGAG